MSINAEIQKLNPGTFIELFELDARFIGADRLFFHAYPQSEKIVWQEVEYSPWPIIAEGFQRTNDRQPTPRLRVGNVGGTISAMCLAYDDLVGAKIIRRRTLGKFLDAINFAEGNATADPSEELIPEVWFIERKVTETVEAVEFELSSALDFSGVKLPRRQIIANMCPSAYRGVECGYAGGPVAKADDTPTSKMSEDRCSKRLSGCRLRYPGNRPLPYGGFPAAALVRS